MGHANIEKFNTKVLNFDGFGFPKKSNITEGFEEMLSVKPIPEQTFRFATKVLRLVDCEFSWRIFYNWKEEVVSISTSTNGHEN